MTGTVERSLDRTAAAVPRRRTRAPLSFIAALALGAIFSALGPGCAHAPQREGLASVETEVPSKGTSAPARLIGNTLVVEAKGEDGATCHFLVDTGSSVNLVSPDFAQRYAVAPGSAPLAPEVTDRSADGAAAVLLAATIGRIQLGGARFGHFPALVFNCGDLSAQFGIPIDGILGFPLFRDTVLTLDYPGERLLLRPEPDNPVDLPVLGGTVVPLKVRNRIPFISVHLAGDRFDALIDSGSDLPLSLNPIDARTPYAYGPVEGGTVGTLAGDRVLWVGRLAGDLTLGGYLVSRPIADSNTRLSAVGGGILKNFAVTFDQRHSWAAFSRTSTDPVAIPPIRTTGLSFQKTPAYWKVVGVIPHSPADDEGIDQGDLVAKVNGEPVAGWGANRYRELEENADSISYTTIDGARETRHEVKVIDLVP